MLSFYCYIHNEEHLASGWRGKPEKTAKGVIIKHYCDNNIAYPEFTTESIKNGRLEYANDQIQSHRQGELSREFLEAHPKQAKKMLDNGVITKEQVKKSKRVWGNDIPGMTKKIDAEALIK